MYKDKFMKFQTKSHHADLLFAFPLAFLRATFLALRILTLVRGSKLMPGRINMSE